MCFGKCAGVRVYACDLVSARVYACVRVRECVGVSHGYIECIVQLSLFPSKATGLKPVPMELLETLVPFDDPNNAPGHLISTIPLTLLFVEIYRSKTKFFLRSSYHAGLTS